MAKLSVFQVCVSNHKVKDCFPLVQILAAGHRCAATLQGWSSESHWTESTKWLFCLICFMSGWTVSPLSLRFCLCSITRATGERQRLALYAFYLKEETAVIPAASLMLLCSDFHGTLWCATHNSDPRVQVKGCLRILWCLSESAYLMCGLPASRPSLAGLAWNQMFWLWG